MRRSFKRQVATVFGLPQFSMSQRDIQPSVAWTTTIVAVFDVSHSEISFGTFPARRRRTCERLKTERRNVRSDIADLFRANFPMNIQCATCRPNIPLGLAHTGFMVSSARAFDLGCFD